MRTQICHVFYQFQIVTWKSFMILADDTAENARCKLCSMSGIWVKYIFFQIRLSHLYSASCSQYKEDEKIINYVCLQLLYSLLSSSSLGYLHPRRRCFVSAYPVNVLRLFFCSRLITFAAHTQRLGNIQGYHILETNLLYRVILFKFC